jgi:uncharacterized membrane protein
VGGVICDPKEIIPIMTLALTWLSALLVFLALDSVWLGVASASLYTGVLGDLMLNGFRIVPAALFYPLQITGIVVFVLPLARQRGNPRTAAPPTPTRSCVGFARAGAFGAFFGLCTYGTYDLTNQAVLKVWTTQLTVIDMAWGTFVTGAASLTAAAVERWRGR